MLVTSGLLSFHRCSAVEQAVLCWLRARDTTEADQRNRRTPRRVGGADLSGIDRSRFVDLRTLAIRQGYDILPLEAPYVSDGERYLLYGLSEFQRERGFEKLTHLPLDLIVHLSFCAGVLAGAGAILPFRRVALTNTHRGFPGRGLYDRVASS